jgi:DNA-binding NarL/FixJ family response regulator
MIRVAVAEDHAEMRVVLKLFINLSSEMDLVCEAVNGQEAVDCVKQVQPDILVMDIQMPILDGLGATKQIVSSGLGTRVILISLHRGRYIVTQAKDAGARGYLPKDDLAGSLLNAIRTVHSGETFFVE